jgi:hypothetical protein
VSTVKRVIAGFCRKKDTADRRSLYVHTTEEKCRLMGHCGYIDTVYSDIEDRWIL